MKLRALIEQTNQECVVIAPPAVNKSVLQELSQRKVFKPLMFMHKQDLIEKVLFKMEDRALHEASVFFDLKPSVVKPWLNLLYVVEDKPYKSKKLNQLVALKKRLVEKKMITFYQHKDVLFKDKKVFVALDQIDGILRKVFAYLETVSDVTFIEEPLTFNNTLHHVHAEHIEDELAYVAHEVRRLHEEGVALKQMAVTTENRFYETSMKRLFKQFQIPVEQHNQEALWALPMVQRFYACFSTRDGTPYEAFKEALDTVKPSHYDDRLLRLYRQLVMLANRFAHVELTLDAIKPLVLDALKTTQVKQPLIDETLKVGSLMRMDVSNVHYLFHVGASESYFPPFKTEDDYLNEAEKREVSLDTASEENKQRKTLLMRKLSTPLHVTISEASQSFSESFFKAAFLDELATITTINSREIPSLVHQPYAKSYDRLRAAKARDAYLTYGEKEEALSVLYPRFMDDLKLYDNRFTGLKKATLERLLPETLRLSYTRLNTYFSCRFRYMLDVLLKLDPDEANLNMDLGSFYHEALERYLKNPKDVDDALEGLLDTLKKERPSYGAREWFFLRESMSHLKEVFAIIKDQHERTDYTLHEQERVVEKPYDGAKLVGVIDQLMTRKTERDVKWLLLDYKTGSATLNLKHALYGLNVQLLYYVLLLKSTFDEGENTITGFYEQTLIMRPKKVKDNETASGLIKDHLKWQGYTLDDVEEVYHIDKDADNESFLKSFRTKKDGSLAKSFKTFTPDDLRELVGHLESLIHEAIASIRQGDFTINPKKDGQKDISCTYCPFRDVCYRQEKDYESLTMPKNEEALFERIKKRGESS